MRHNSMWKPNSQKCRWYEQWAMASLLALWAVGPGWGYALPTEGEIASGTGSIQQPTEQDLVIQQDSQQLITSARDIDVSGNTINATGESFNETRNLILNGNTVGGDTGTAPPPEGTVDAGSFQQGLLNGFILQFFDNALTRC